MIFGTGLRDDLVLPNGSDIPNGDHTPSYTQINLGVSHEFRLPGWGPLTVRFDVINVTDKVYQIRSGAGIGVFAPQYGPPSGFFGGLAWKFWSSIAASLHRCSQKAVCPALTSIP